MFLIRYYTGINLLVRLQLHVVLGFTTWFIPLIRETPVVWDDVAFGVYFVLNILGAIYTCRELIQVGSVIDLIQNSYDKE